VPGIFAIKELKVHKVAKNCACSISKWEDNKVVATTQGPIVNWREAALNTDARNKCF